MSGMARDALRMPGKVATLATCLSGSFWSELFSMSAEA
jgi:hypothetical protein